MRLPSLDKIAFVGSLLVFAFLYGIATQAFGLFPSDLMRRAWNQAEAVSPLSTNALTGSEATPPPSMWTSRVYDESGVTKTSQGSVRSGLTLISSAWSFSDSIWSPGLRLIDQNGRVIHEWIISPEEIFSDSAAAPDLPLQKENIHGTYLFPNGDVLVNISYVGTARLDACSRVIWKNSKYNFHHSIARGSDGTFWIPGVRRDVSVQSQEYPDGYPGLKNPIHQSFIVNLSADGGVIDTINVLDVLYNNGLQRHIPQAMPDRHKGRPYGRDVVHMNDIEPLPDSLDAAYPLFDAGDLVVSLRNPNLVFVVDPDSKSVKWHATHPFIQQHDPDFIGNGWIGVFDNNYDGTKRGSMLGGSRIVLLRPHSDSMKVAFPTPKSEPFYTDAQGKWQMLRNGNLLLSETHAGRVVEVGPDGQTVWEWIHEPSTDTAVAAVPKATRLTIKPTNIASWPCSST